MNLKLELEFSKADIIKEVDALKKQVDALRPLPPDIEGRVMQKLRLDWNYHSNAIEGNRLSYGETVAFLMEGITAKGKPLKDHLDIRGHNEAINFLLEIVKDTRLITETDIRNLHKMILVEPYDSPAKTAEGLPTTKRITLGQYKTSPNHVKTATGETHYYATPEETPAKMQELMEWYEEVKQRPVDIHPIVIAAQFHHKFVEIHPFDDGNGRLSRILMNLILMRHDYPPVVVKMDNRQNYYALLSRADRGDSWPFVEYIAGLTKNSLQLYLKAANGGDIDEDEDIDKEIALFKIELENETHLQTKKSKDIINKIFTEEILGLYKRLSSKIDPISNSFFKSDVWLRFKYIKDNVRDYDLKKYKEDLSEVIAYISNSTIEYIEIEFDASYEEFKKADNAFTVASKLGLFFKPFKYDILINETFVLSKHYHEKLSEKDIQNIIKMYFIDLKNKIEIKLKSSKP
jgi:Fic family protein